jgi:hypothetical protein
MESDAKDLAKDQQKVEKKAEKLEHKEEKHEKKFEKHMVRLSCLELKGSFAMAGSPIASVLPLQPNHDARSETQTTNQ